MTRTSLDLAEVEACINEAVLPVARQYRRHVSRDDLAQECWMWVYERQSTVAGMLVDKRPALRLRLRRVAERLARREKAAQSGYGPDDEVFYSLQALRTILPDALDPTATPSQQAQEVRVASSRDGYGGWEAGVADVRGAVARLSAEDVTLLMLHYRVGLSPDELGARYGITTDAVYSRLGRTLRRLQRHLGGVSPHRGDG